MISKLTRVRLLAALCGPVLGIATAFCLNLATSVTLHLLPNTEAAIWEPIAHILAWIPATLCIAGLCVVLGAYDLLAIVTCIIPALLYFAFNYRAAISIFLPNDGHTFYDVLGTFPPFDYKDQALFLSKLLLWALSAAAAGIALKRWLSRWCGKATPTVLAPKEKHLLWRGMVFDIGLISLVIFVVLGVDLRNQLRLGSPDFLTASTATILDSPTSTPAEREDALTEMQRFSDKFSPDDTRRAVALLQRELPVQPSPINLTVADMLILFHDDSGVPMLREALTHALEAGSAVPPDKWAEVISRLELAKVPLAASTLLPLLTSPAPITREEAACALRGVMSLRQEHMSRFVPGWPSMTDVAAVTKAMIAALDDNDQRVRYFAVCTLTEINVNPHYPGIQLFEENESAYVDGWKAWAKQAGPVPAAL